MNKMNNQDTHMFFNRKTFIAVLICCALFCGCDREIPINERPMYGNMTPSPEMQKANKEFIENVEKEGGREYGARKAIDRGWNYYKKGDLATAMKRFNQAWLLNPNNPEVYLGFGCIAEKKNNATEAINMTSRAINLNPNYAAAYSNRGVYYFRRGDRHHKMDDIKNAISDFTKAIEINPKDAQNYNDRAACYATIKEYDKSWSDLQKAQELGYKVNPEFINRIKKEAGIKE